MCKIQKHNYSCGHHIRYAHSRCRGTMRKLTLSEPTVALCKSWEYIILSSPSRCGKCQHREWEAAWEVKLQSKHLEISQMVLQGKMSDETVKQMLWKLDRQKEEEAWGLRKIFSSSIREGIGFVRPLPDDNYELDQTTSPPVLKLRFPRSRLRHEISPDEIGIRDEDDDDMGESTQDPLIDTSYDWFTQWLDEAPSTETDQEKDEDWTTEEEPAWDQPNWDEQPAWDTESPVASNGTCATPYTEIEDEAVDHDLPSPKSKDEDHDQRTDSPMLLALGPEATLGAAAQTALLKLDGLTSNLPGPVPDARLDTALLNLDGLTPVLSAPPITKAPPLPNPKTYIGERGAFHEAPGPYTYFARHGRKPKEHLEAMRKMAWGLGASSKETRSAARQWG